MSTAYYDIIIFNNKLLTRTLHCTSTRFKNEVKVSLVGCTTTIVGAVGTAKKGKQKFHDIHLLSVSNQTNSRGISLAQLFFHIYLLIFGGRGVGAKYFRSLFINSEFNDRISMTKLPASIATSLCP